MFSEKKNDWVLVFIDALFCQFPNFKFGVQIRNFALHFRRNRLKKGLSPKPQQNILVTGYSLNVYNSSKICYVMFYIKLIL